MLYEMHPTAVSMVGGSPPGIGIPNAYWNVASPRPRSRSMLSGVCQRSHCATVCVVEYVWLSVEHELLDDDLLRRHASRKPVYPGTILLQHRCLEETVRSRRMLTVG